MTTINETVTGLQQETPLDFSAYAPKSQWEGWFRGVIKADYEAGGYTFRTEDVPVRDTTKTSRNLRISATVTNKQGDERNVNGQFNYEPNDVTGTRKAAVDSAVETASAAFKAAKEAFAQANGGSAKGFPRKIHEFTPKDVTRTRIFYQLLGGLQAAVPAFKPMINGNGGFDVSTLIGEAVDIRLGTSESGYPEIKEFAKARSHKETR